MEISIDQTDLRRFLADSIPEARQEFMALPGEASIYTTLYKLYDVTSVLAHQNKFKAVKRCLLVAEELLLGGEKRISNAVCTIYIYRLALLLDKRDARAEVIHYLLPRGIRTEYQRQVNTCLP
jgi:hypothetical protein